MNRRPGYLGLLLILVMGGIGVAVSGGDDCLYSEENVRIYKNRYLDNPSLKQARWNEKNKRLSATTPWGDRLTIEISACHELGVRAEIVLYDPRVITNSAFLTERVRWLARQIFEPEDKEEIEKRIDSPSYRAGVKKGEFLSFFSGKHFSQLRMELYRQGSQWTVVLFGAMA